MSRERTWPTTKSTRHIGAARKGFLAQRKGIPIFDCPYEHATMWKYWVQGWRFAQYNQDLKNYPGAADE